MKLRILSLAARDASEARRWYSEQNPALGDRFETALGDTFAHLLEHPRAFPIVRRDIRRAPVGDAFSVYQIYYRLEETDLVVVAVVHSARHPRHWQRRR
ncbi:MAG TPA: type II toxin-antitoxin system RelE/ParE family toxin [Solirubrobacterales bacterium]|nr:type II toxin-antitoxin system RelE/ParE family toxin [Solirubrobacterales bacterium]